MKYELIAKSSDTKNESKVELTMTTEYEMIIGDSFINQKYNLEGTITGRKFVFDENGELKSVMLYI
ncbi:MAG TPA: hypothetical protein VJY99_03745 [Buttiauxella sp.]|uniref:hypothetical protein n=1 Tax=Buttiauxella sp. TaxID=1972222 RepID=UPI002B464F9F|nr:hypothetical protein [Buttiauxella sp.]HKM95813.1 hypothetical protein [Buttiauxella sp.]